MQRLGKRADVVERALRDFADLTQIGAERRILRQMFFRATEERADSRQNLAELVVELAGYVTQGGFLSRDQFLGEIAALTRERVELREKAAIRTHEIKAGQDNCNQNRGQKKKYLPLNPIVDLTDLPGRLLLADVVFNELAGDGGGERCLAGLQRDSNLTASLFIIAIASQRERPVHSVPKLCERVGQELNLLRRAMDGGRLPFEPQCINEVRADALKLRRPRRERIWLVVGKHVAHGETKRIQIILDPQQLQGVLSILLRCVALQLAQTRDLHADVSGIGNHRYQRDQEAEKQAEGGRALDFTRHAPRI